MKEEFALCFNLRAGKTPGLDQIVDAYQKFQNYITENGLNLDIFFHLGSCQLVILGQSQELEKVFNLKWKIANHRYDYYESPTWRREIICVSIHVPSELKNIVDFSQVKYSSDAFSMPCKYLSNLFLKCGVKTKAERAM